MSTESTYKSFALFYDDYVKGFTMDLPVYRHFCNNTHRILEVGCGSGRVLVDLAKAGCNVLGVDISDEMLALAKGKLASQIETGQIRLDNFNFLGGSLEEKFDRVLVTFYTLNYLRDKTDCTRFLQNIAASMKDGGYILMDLFYPTPMQKPETNGIWVEKDLNIHGNFVKLRDRRTMTGSMEERIQTYTSSKWSQQIVTERRYYSKQDIQNILRQCGFSNISFTDGYSIDRFHNVEENEAVTTSFMVKAEKL